MGARIASPVNPDESVLAFLFDLDGTLYAQRPLQLRMAAELALLPLTRPLTALRTWRGIAAYRKAQEALRNSPSTDRASERQLEHASAASGVPLETLRPIIQEWMVDRPLKHLAACRAPGLIELLNFLDDADIECGVLSDYPVERKLHALGIVERFSLMLCSTDPSIGAFKPSPRGFLAAATAWNLDPREVLVVGDRLDVDAAGARAAGMPCVIVSKGASASKPQDGVLVVNSLERLHRVLDGR